MTTQTPARRGGREHRSAGVVGILALTAAILAVAGALAGSAPADAAQTPPAARSAAAASEDGARRGEVPGRDAVHRLQIVANLRAEPPKSPVVLLLGGSSARESTVDDASWAADIVRLGGPPVTVYNLGCRHDTFAEDLEIVKLLPKDAPMLVLIGVNLGRFANPQRPAPPVTLPESMDPPPAYSQHIYSVTKRVQPRETKASAVLYWLKVRDSQFVDRFGYNLGVLDRVVEACRQRGLRPVLLDLPRDLEVIGRAFDGQVGRVKAGCSVIAETHGIPWLTPVRASGLEDADFFDLWHLVEPGRVKYQARVSFKLVSLLHQYGMDQPAAAETEDAAD